MKKQVSVMIKWNEDAAVLKTQHGLEWSFKCPDSSMVKGENLSAVSSLASALLAVTIRNWVENSKADNVCFTLTAEDIF